MKAKTVTNRQIFEHVGLALQLCDGLLGEAVTDGDTLHMLSTTLRYMQREADIIPLYEAASSARPRDEDLLLLLFESYVK